MLDAVVEVVMLTRGLLFDGDVDAVNFQQSPLLKSRLDLIILLVQLYKDLRR